MYFFETIKIENGTVFHLDYHEKRIAKALNSIQTASFFSLKTLIKPPSLALLRCKVIYNHNTVKVEYHDYTPRSIKTLQALTCKGISYTHKYLNRDKIDTCFGMKDSTADDILIINAQGYIQDTSIANIAFKLENRWFTPSTPLLEGTTRARLLDEKYLHVRDLHIEDIRSIQGFGLLNAMIGFHQVENGIILH